MSTPDQRLQDLGIELADFTPFHPAGAAGVITAGNLLLVSGSTPGSPEFRGRVGDVLTVEQGYQALPGHVAVEVETIFEIEEAGMAISLIPPGDMGDGLGEGIAVPHLAGRNVTSGVAQDGPCGVIPVLMPGLWQSPRPLPSSRSPPYMVLAGRARDASLQRRQIAAAR